MQILLGAALILLVALIATVVWLSRARKDAVQAKTEADALKAGEEKRRVADQIMAQPSAYEPMWLKLARERLRERDRKP